mgnify:FL=1
MWASFALFALCGFAVIRDAKQGTGIAGTGLLAGLLAAVALVEMLASGLADVLDVTRHYYLFGALWDCLLMLLVLSAIGRAQRD